MKSLLSLALLLFASPVLAGPFGFDTASKKNLADVYSYCSKDNEKKIYNISCSDAPKSHPDIQVYQMRYIDSVGLCSIQGVGYNINDSDRGVSTRRKTDDIANQIKIKYGNWDKKYDSIYSSSIWDEPGDWMMSIIQNDRVYAYLWQLNPPINGVKTIAVAAEALERDVGFVLVEFNTPLYDKCKEVTKISGSDSF